MLSAGAKNDPERVVNELFLGTQKEGILPSFDVIPKIAYCVASSRLAMGEKPEHTDVCEDFSIRA